MHPLGQSWLAASAAAPLVAVLTLWTIYVFHTYRSQWKTVDIFLLATAAQELVTTSFAFAFALLNLLGPRLGEAPCGLLLWGLTSTRTFQVATLTSLLVDRALTIRWPYRYRLSVRPNQIRYHIAVLAVTSLFMGVAAVFARLQHVVVPQPGLDPAPLAATCSLHPLGWDIRFCIFVLCLYGVLSLTAVVCWVDVESKRCRQTPLAPSPTGPYVMPLPETRVGPGGASGHVQMSSATGSVSSTSSESTRFLYCRRKFEDGMTAVMDFRWTVVATVSLACFTINHFPFLVLTLLGTVVPSVWSSWHENVLLWLRLLEGLLLPPLLLLTDQPHRAGFQRIWAKAEIKNTFKDVPTKPTGKGARYPPVFQDVSEAPPLYSGLTLKLPPYTSSVLPVKGNGPFGSLTPVGIITNYRRTRDTSSFKTRSWIKSWNSFAMPNVYGALDPAVHGSRARYFPHFDFPTHCVLHDDHTVKKNKHDFDDDEMLSEETLHYKGVDDEEEEEHIYASLSEVGENFSLQSTVADDSALMGEDVYGGSFTTVANDDFEFHDTRPCGGEVRMRPGIVLPTRSSFPPPAPTVNFQEANREMSSTQEDDMDDKMSTISSDSSSVREVVIRLSDSSLPSKADSGTYHSVNEDGTEDSPLRVYRVADETLRTQLTGSRKNTSFSMNDLDLIDDVAGSTCKSESDKEEDQEEDVNPLYVYPIKCESTASLQSANSPTKSSDFGSFRAQSEGRLDWRSSDLGSLWENSRRRPSSILSEVMQYSRSKRHIIKTKKYRVSSQGSVSGSSKCSDSPVSLSAVQRTGSDLRHYRRFQHHNHHENAPDSPLQLPYPLNANFRLQHAPGYPDNFGYHLSPGPNQQPHYRHPHQTKRCTMSEFI